MKKCILVLVILVYSFGFGQDITSIKKIVSGINQTKNFTMKTVPNSFYLDKNISTDNGIELKGFYKNNQLVKMEHWVGLSAWKIITQYFFSNKNELVFVHSKKYQIIDENGYLKNPKKLSESRYYYRNEKLISSSGNSLYKDEKVDYVKESKILMNDLKLSKYK